MKRRVRFFYEDSWSAWMDEGDDLSIFKDVYVKAIQVQEEVSRSELRELADRDCVYAVLLRDAKIDIG